ncbi:unnamed protein product [Heligmosomoides polygyrus]|uniref:non-specific serine/threonine protein kinase n=1 Tax=Heligmosomoides polygyrus TaxID=6339 RepID=A0A183G173_HELPZ|nr:unnamed protein product [Heligmosomoides polygyrus]
MISGGIHQFGDEKLRFLVIPKYATSLEAIREKRKTFTQNEVWTIARCMLESLEYIHEKNYTHADIKAANILLEKPDDFSTSVLVDYGLARMSVNNEDKPDKKRAHNGTAIFTSCDAHRGNHPSYRGDLEILAYNMVYWLSGSLPWEAQESSPEKVFQQKEVFLKELPSSLKSCLKDCSESISPLNEVFAIALKTGYAEQLDFPKLYKIVDSVLKKSRAVKRKSPAEDVAVEVEVKKPALAKRDRAASIESSSKADAKPNRADAVESSSKADLKSKRADAVESSSKADLKPKRAGAVESSSKADLKSKRADAVESSSKTDLKPKRADAVGLAAGVSSSQKRSPTRLKMIPGMNNFARGRRSIIVDQISKKYKRIADKKKRLS